MPYSQTMEHRCKIAALCADWASLVLVLGSLLQWLPAVASTIGAAWYIIQIWESDTGKWWRRRWRLYWGVFEARWAAILISLFCLATALAYAGISGAFG